MTVCDEIQAERDAHKTREGWSDEIDDLHVNSELSFAAASYAMHASKFRDAEIYGVNYQIKAPPPSWPWANRWWKPKDKRRDLIKAAALIVAEIERLDRWSSQ